MISLDSRMDFYDQNSEKNWPENQKFDIITFKQKWPCPKHFSSNTPYFRTVSFINDSGTFFAVSLVSRLVSGLGSGVLITSCSTVLLYSTSWKPATVVVSSISINVKLCRSKTKLKFVRGNGLQFTITFTNVQPELLDSSADDSALSTFKRLVR